MSLEEVLRRKAAEKAAEQQRQQQEKEAIAVITKAQRLIICSPAIAPTRELIRVSWLSNDICVYVC